MSIKHICIITSGYPSFRNPQIYSFLGQLACAFADAEKMVSVINPVPYGRSKERGYIKPAWKQITLAGNYVKVYQPRLFSFSSKQVCGFSTADITQISFEYVVNRQLNSMRHKPDILYSHFLGAGATAGNAGARLGVPSFCAFGEDGLWSLNGFNRTKMLRALFKLTGIIAVSTNNKHVLHENGIYDESKIIVLPNAVDHNLFYPRDKLEMRAKYQLPLGDAIGIFVGSFDERKGSLRVQQAAHGIENLKMIYIGAGNLEPTDNNIIFKGQVAHSKISEYLSAADFFVLPTRSEGCCNAIIEAMACGLPIISSVGAFNDDILTPEYSLRVEPDDIKAIHDAMEYMCKNKTQREAMGSIAWKAAQSFDINIRAQKILDFMEGHANESK